jgi:hypothetical protein
MTKELDVIPTATIAPLGATNIVMILDRSGSMAGRETDVIGGFNSFVSSCRDASIANCSVTYVRFDDDIERVFVEELANVPEMTSTLYTPRGGTALLDALGQTVSPMTNEPDDRYIVVTFTDGEENSSREWTKEKVAELLHDREALGNWTFAFFGADIDAWSEAGGMGFGAGNAKSHARASAPAMMKGTGRVAAVMAKSHLKSSRYYADAVESAAQRPDVSDTEIERILGGIGEARSQPPVVKLA